MRLKHLTLAKDGEDENGDAVVVREEEGWALVAVIDALGHGPKAAEAARAAVGFLGALPRSESLRGAMMGLHQALRGTRGAAAMVCLLTGEKIEGCGVGNVELRCLEAKLPIVLSPGVLGSRVEAFRYFHAPLPARGRLVCFSDGISRRTPFDDLRHLGPGEFCKAVMDGHRKPLDDATVLVCDIEA